MIRHASLFSQLIALFNRQCFYELFLNNIKNAMPNASAHGRASGTPVGK